MSEQEQRYGGTELRNMAEGPVKRRGCCTRHPFLCCSILMVTLLLALAIGGLAGGFYRKIDSTVDDLIADHVKLLNGSTAADQFTSSSAPLYAKYYFFNVTNPEEVVNGKNPKVKQVGPFVYKENRTKFDLEWEENGTILSYGLDINYTFVQNMSYGDPTKTFITTVNIPLLGVAMTINEFESDPNLNWVEREALRELIRLLDDLKKETSWEGVFTKRTPDQLLWGYTDDLLKDLTEIPIVGPKLGISTTFGYSNRSSVEAPNRVFTGSNDTNLVGTFIQWNGNTEIKGWNTSYARMINGTGGFIFHPGVTRDENLTVFVSELYRSGYFSYKQDVDVHGIKLYQFILPDDELDNTNQDPGFYPFSPNGVLNLTSVIPNNIPLFASKPHFLGADPGYLKNVSGLAPDVTIHDSFLDVEPLTGAVLKAAKRIQLNLRMTNFSSIPEFSKLRDGLMLPVWYASEEGGVDTELANEFKSAVYTVEYGIEGGVFAVIGLAGLVSVVCVLCLVGLLIQQCRIYHSDPMRHRREVLINRDEFSPLLNGRNGPGGNTDI